MFWFKYLLFCTLLKWIIELNWLLTNRNVNIREKRMGTVVLRRSPSARLYPDRDPSGPNLLLNLVLVEESESLLLRFHSANHCVSTFVTVAAVAEFPQNTHNWNIPAIPWLSLPVGKQILKGSLHQRHLKNGQRDHHLSRS